MRAKRRKARRRLGLPRHGTVCQRDGWRVVLDKKKSVCRVARRQPLRVKYRHQACGRLFQGITASMCAMPQKPLIPANSRPAPTKADSA